MTPSGVVVVDGAVLQMMMGFHYSSLAFQPSSDELPVHFEEGGGVDENGACHDDAYTAGTDDKLVDKRPQPEYG